MHHNEFVGDVPEELCELRDEGSLHFLWVDCSPMPTTNVPKVACPIDNCCSICFEGYDEDGGPSSGGSSPTSKVDTPHAVQSDSDSELKTVLMDASSDKGMALMDINSPQFHSYAWLAGDPAISSYNNARILQRYALGVLYFATNGVNWSLSDNWVTTADECKWYGVNGCKNADTEKISSIQLKANGLKGTIPPELFEFIPTLLTLNLATNILSGPIPKEIGMLQDINSLELAENQLTSIPTEMGNLNTLDHLFLQSNNFGGQLMPEEVCQLRTAGTLTLLWADCKGDGEVSLQCSAECCTTCFSDEYVSTSASSSLSSSSGGGDNMFEVNTDSSVAVSHADSDGDVLAKLKKMAPGKKNVACYILSILNMLTNHGPLSKYWMKALH